MVYFQGLYLEIAGPTMIDLKILFNTDYASVTRSMAGRGAGGILGAVIGAFLVDKYEGYLDLCIGVCSTMAAVCLTAIPHMPDINYVWLLFFIIGGLSCIKNMGKYIIILQLNLDSSSRDSSSTWYSRKHRLTHITLFLSFCTHHCCGGYFYKSESPRERI